MCVYTAIGIHLAYTVCTLKHRTKVYGFYKHTGHRPQSFAFCFSAFVRRFGLEN
jgi:hypothetical protein